MLNPLKYALSTLPSTTSHRTGTWKNCCSRIYVTILRYSLVELEQNATLEAKHRNKPAASNLVAPLICD